MILHDKVGDTFHEECCHVTLGYVPFMIKENNSLDSFPLHGEIGDRVIDIHDYTHAMFNIGELMVSHGALCHSVHYFLGCVSYGLSEEKLSSLIVSSMAFS